MVERDAQKQSIEEEEQTPTLLPIINDTCSINANFPVPNIQLTPARETAPESRNRVHEDSSLICKID